MSTFPPGPFFIKNASYEGYVLDVMEGSLDAGTTVILFNLHYGQNQQWIYENGFIKSVKSGLYLEANLDASGNIRPGAGICQGPKRPFGKDHNQIWVYNAHYQFLTPWDPRAQNLTIGGVTYGTHEGARVVLEQLECFPKGVPAQKWIIVPV